MAPYDSSASSCILSLDEGQGTLWCMDAGPHGTVGGGVGHVDGLSIQDDRNNNFIIILL